MFKNIFKVAELKMMDSLPKTFSFNATLENIHSCYIILRCDLITSNNFGDTALH